MKEYYVSCGIRKGVIKVIYSWTWLEKRSNINLVCVVDGIVKEIWGLDHPSVEIYNGVNVLHVNSSNFRNMLELTPLTKELL